MPVMPDSEDERARKLRLAIICAAAITRIDVTPDIAARLLKFVRSTLSTDLALTKPIDPGGGP